MFYTYTTGSTTGNEGGGGGVHSLGIVSSSCNSKLSTSDINY